MMALSAASFALMIAGVGGYVSAIPAVVSDKPSAVVIPLESALWLDGQMREVQAGPVGSTRAVGPVTIGASQGQCRRARCCVGLGPWFGLRRVGRCVVDWGDGGFLGGFVVRSVPSRSPVATRRPRARLRRRLLRPRAAAGPRPAPARAAPAAQAMRSAVPGGSGAGSENAGAPALLRSHARPAHGRAGGGRRMPCWSIIRPA